MPFFGGGGGTGGGPYTVITTTSTLESQKSYMVDTSSSAYTVTLPATPANGDYVEIFDRANSFGANNLTIDRNGNKIESLTENLTGNVNGAAFKLAYADSTTGWQIIPFYGFAGPNFVGATTSTAGVAGVVPAPAAGKKTRPLFSNAGFEEIPLFPLRKAANTLWVASKIFGVGAAVQNQTPAARRRQFGLGFFPDDGNIDTLGARIAGTAPSSSVNLHLGLWECGEDGLPSTFIVGGTTTSGTSANTDISISVASTAVKRGYFYFALTLETSTGAWNGNSATAYGFASSINGVEANPASNGNSPYYVATTYDQTTHGTFLFDGSGIAQVSYQWA